MVTLLRSCWIWFAVVTLIVAWLPFLALVRLLDRDPVRYRTGLMFRRLGRLLTRINPVWRIEFSGIHVADPRHPYVVVSNHQSLADIPIISHLRMEMKWLAKEELFSLPFAGWMMRLAGDISVNRSDSRSGAKSMLTAARYLQGRCSVMFFPEGTRSHDGRLGRFNEGAFHLAIREQVPVLPVVVEGTRDCLPKKSWKFGGVQNIKLTVLPPVPTTGLVSNDTARLKDNVRGLILEQLAAFRGVAAEAVDGLRQA
jgi:1-acyl-sn-glycerol-3-phosphate acyltransferase